MTLANSVLATLAYHDIFDYPLNLAEIHRYLIGRKDPISRVAKSVGHLLQDRKIGQRHNYFYLKGNLKIVLKRWQRSRTSAKKLKKGYFFAQILKVIPTLKLVAVSGALAMGNSHKDDDIDLVLVTSAGLLWTTRFLANVLLLLFKRDPRGKKIADRACLNIFIDESDLKIRPANLYLAHEIAQMKPLWDRDGTYQKFIGANQWIKKYLPNWRSSTENLDHRSQKSSPKVRLRTMNYLLRTVENLLRNFQLWYMRSKVTTERIGKTQLFFHPVDTQNKVMKDYQKRLKRLLSD